MTHVPERPLTREENATLCSHLWAFADRREFVAAKLTNNRVRLAAVREQFAALRGEVTL